MVIESRRALLSTLLQDFLRASFGLPRGVGRVVHPHGGGLASPGRSPRYPSWPASGAHDRALPSRRLRRPSRPRRPSLSYPFVLAAHLATLSPLQHHMLVHGSTAPHLGDARRTALRGNGMGGQRRAAHRARAWEPCSRIPPCSGTRRFGSRRDELWLPAGGSTGAAGSSSPARHGKDGGQSGRAATPGATAQHRG
jgi:hypothetical protein